MSYIPKSNIKISNTPGGVFVWKRRKEQFYSGVYIETSEGRYYATNDPLRLVPKLEIVKYEHVKARVKKHTEYKNKKSFGESLSFKKHKILKGAIYNTLEKVKPVMFQKTFPTKKDYKRGWFTRFFAKRVNSDFEYSSDKNVKFLSIKEIKEFNKKYYNDPV